MLRKVHCPYCKMRLFDARDTANGQIDIKCTRCGRIIKVELKETMPKTASG